MSSSTSSEAQTPSPSCSASTAGGHQPPNGTISGHSRHPVSTSSARRSNTTTTCLPAGLFSTKLPFSVTLTSSILSPRQHLLFGLIFLISNIHANEFEPHPPLLTAQKTQFHFDKINYYAINLPNAKLIYSTSLQESRQIFAVSKTIDFSELSIANENLLLSLKNIERQNYLEDFDEYRFYIDTEIHLSSIRMPFRNCQRHCLRGGARMIDTPTAFYRVVNSFSPDSVWVNPHVNASTDDYTANYTVYLGPVQIYPKNDLGIGNPKIFYFKDMKTKIISTIGTGYIYYNPHSASYWTRHVYRLQTAMTKDGLAQLYIPEDERFLTPQKHHHYCGCYRTPSISTKLFNDLTRDINGFKHQKSALNLGIEPERLHLNTSSGSLLPILKPYLNENSPVKRDSPCYIDKVAPLLPEVVTHDNLIHSFMFLTAKKIGTSVALALLDSSLAQIKKKYGASVLNDIWQSNDKNTNFFDFTNLSLSPQNFTLIVKMDNHLYRQNVSNNIILADKLLKNITITNERFSKFLQTSAQKLLLEMAADSLNDPIDYDTPVLAVVKQGKSFLTATFFITTKSPDTTITNYLANALPSSIQDSTLYGIKIPFSFSSVSLGHSYRFHDSESQALDSCVNSFMGTSNFENIIHECPSAEHPTQKLRILQTVEHNNLLLARGRKETLKIVCPNSEPHFFTMSHDILIIIVHHSCESNLISKTGVLTIRRNDSGISTQDFEPHLLFTYDLEKNFSIDFYQWIMIATIISLLALFIIVLIFALYLVYKRRITAQIISRQPSEENLETSTSVLFKESSL